MENLSVQQKHTKQHTRVTNKKKPFKVVYISNPMKFTASADQFRAVVQRLTGMDSNIADLADQNLNYQTAYPVETNFPETISNETFQHSELDQLFAYPSNRCIYDDFETNLDIYDDLSSMF